MSKFKELFDEVMNIDEKEMSNDETIKAWKRELSEYEKGIKKFKSPKDDDFIEFYKENIKEMKDIIKNLEK